MKNVEFHNSEEALEALRLATEAADLGVWDFNIETNELHWSERCKAIFGVTDPGSLTLRTFLDRLHPDERDRVSAAMAACFDPTGSREYDIEYRICRPNQELRFLHARGKSFFTEVDGTLKPTRFVGTVLDRTDQRLAQAALIQAEQLAVTGRLAASIAHEINNPLEAVTNLLYLLRDEVHSQEGTAYLKQAESELARVSDIATNTLRFYRDPNGTVDVDVSKLTQSVIALFHGKMAVHRVRLEFDCAPGSIVSTQQGQLRQVLVNLIGNAIDAMPRGGTLRIRCRPILSADGGSDRRVRLSIADTGAGMPPEVLRRAFEPFYTTKGSAGTGLGLWLSREIARKQGYRLKVKSKPGCGTVFSLSMPRSSSPS